MSIWHVVGGEGLTLLLIPHAKGFTNHNRGYLHNESIKVQLAYFISRGKILTQNLIWLFGERNIDWLSLNIIKNVLKGAFKIGLTGLYVEATPQSLLLWTMGYDFA